MHKASQKYGRFPWRDLIEPTIKLARNGFEISAPVADALDNPPGIKSFIRKDPGLRCDIYAVLI